MQKTTKAVVCGLSVLLALGLASCNKGPKMSKNVDPELAKEFKDVVTQADPVTKKAYDFGGINVRINDHWDSADGAHSGEPTTPAAELEQKYLTFLEQNYNVKVDMYGGLGSWGDWPEVIANYCTTGGSEYYGFIADGRSIGAGIKANLFYDWSKADIDFSKAKWDAGVAGRVTKGSQILAARGIAPEPRNGIFFNKRLLKEANIDPDSIYDLQKNGKWTWAAFEDLLAKVTRDTDNDGIIDVWGFACNTGYLGNCTILSNGVQYVDKDANGKYVNNFGNDKVIEAMEWSGKIFQNYYKPQPEGSNWDWFFSAFTNGETVFCIEQEYNVTGTFAGMEDDWGFVCFPVGPNGDKVKNISDDWAIVIPAIYGDEKAAKIAKAYDLMTDPIPGQADDAWKDGYYAQFRDERAVDETLQYMRDDAVSSFSIDVAGVEFGHYFWNVAPGYQTPQEGYEATKNEFDAAIAAMNQ